MKIKELEKKYMDKVIGGLPGDIEYKTRQHFKQRLKERKGIKINDVMYYSLCCIAAKRSLKNKDKGWVSPTNPDCIYITLSINYKRFDCLYDFISGHLLTTFGGAKTKSTWTDLIIK